MEKTNLPKNQFQNFSKARSMKKYFFLFFYSSLLVTALVNGCSKDNLPPPVKGISTSFTEEFESVPDLTRAKGWVIKFNHGSSDAAVWTQGYETYDKMSGQSGFPAYSYSMSPTEFIYSYSGTSGGKTVSSWLITPVLSVKNGDKISFYSQVDTDMGTVHNDRLQVLMNGSDKINIGSSSVSTGNFSTVLLDINPNQAAGVYPATWTKYEYTFSGLSGQVNTRVAFRYFIPAPNMGKGVGIDQFKFEVL